MILTPAELLRLSQSDIFTYAFCESCPISVPIRDVVSVLGGSADLPCDILPEDAHDDVYLVLWFKDAATKPMFRSVKLHSDVNFIYYASCINL